MAKHMEPVTVSYSKSLIRKAVRAFWWRNIGVTFPVVVCGLSAFVVYRIYIGDHSWYIGVFGTLCALSAAAIGALYFVHLRRSLARLGRMKTPEAELQFTDSDLKITSDVGSSSFQWSLIEKVWTFDEFWIVLFSASEFMVLPSKELTEDHRTFMRFKILANGGEFA